MKIQQKLLIALLIISGLMPLYVTVLAFAESDALLKMFAITPSPGLLPLVTAMGVCTFAYFLFYIYAALLLIKKNPAGLPFARFIGWVVVFGGIIMLLKFRQENFAGTIMFAPDLIKGSVILLLTYFNSKTLQASNK